MNNSSRWIYNITIRNAFIHIKAPSILIFCLMHFSLFVGVLCWSLFVYALLCVLSSFAIILKRKRAGCYAFISYGRLVTKMFSGSSSRGPGLVCSVWLWYFLIILTYFSIQLSCCNVLSSTYLTNHVSLKPVKTDDTYLRLSHAITKFTTIKCTAQPYIFIRHLNIY